MEEAERAAADVGGAEAEVLGRDDVVVPMVADVHDFAGLHWGPLSDLGEERGVRLRDAPAARRCDGVYRQVEGSE
ncbi:MAG TPA: hypothetical protein VL551_04120 [Actinospica sp.]|nr:hypothetical protein [Actinospica sp.]